jgi:hypothetical protein
MTIGIAPSNAKAAPVQVQRPWTKRCKADAGPASQPPLRGRHESSCLLMARHNQLDARSAKRLDDIEILFTWYAEDPLDAFILQGGDKQVRTFHMLASWLMASEHGMIHTISSNCLSARLPEFVGQRRYQYQTEQTTECSR